MTTPGPPYRRIVDEVRRRIESGELRPGDRVPSARRMTREWGIAIATAARVLAALRQEGLVRPVAGVGTLVAPREAAGVGRPAIVDGPAGSIDPAASAERVRAGRPPSDLSRDRIVRAATALADAEGLSALSMRRVAADLGVSTMALYRHVRDKEDLIVLMIDTAIGAERLPADPPDDWRARLEMIARLQWRLFQRHRWLAPAMSMTRPQLLPQALTHAEWAMSALAGLGLDAAATLHMHVVLFSHGRGLATGVEDEAVAEQDSGLTNDEWMAAQEEALAALAGSGAFGALLAAVRDEGVELDLGTVFEFGLQRLLDGFAVLVAAGTSPP